MKQVDGGEKKLNRQDTILGETTSHGHTLAFEVFAQEGSAFATIVTLPTLGPS